MTARRAFSQGAALRDGYGLGKNTRYTAYKGGIMTNLRQKVLGVGLTAASSLLAMHAAYALNGPSNIQIDGGPLGPLQLSGGVTGYFYGQSGTSSRGESGNSAVGNQSTGANLGSALIELQKTDGTLQFTIEVGPTGGTPALGAKPSKGNVTIYRASPLYSGYVTIAPPNSPITISVGQFGSLEGYESGVDWNNANLFTSDIWYVENSQNVGVSVNYTKGPLSLTVDFGDGWDTRVFNFLQALGTYTINNTNSVSVFYAGNLGTTGINTITYGGTPVAVYGANYMNSQMFGGWYSWSKGNLSLVPEAQFVYAKPNQKLGDLSYKYTSNFGAAVFADYTFGTSPYSIGGMAEYFDSVGSSYWFLGPRAAGVGFEVTPTWQYKDLFARVSAGYLHLTNGSAYGNNGNGKDVVQGALEGGILF
jgi:Putative beta-barrel porin-2, OmpL-like. bbp2